MTNSLTSIQKRIHVILQDYEKPYWDPLSNVARLAEEVGEVARIINHRYGDKPKKQSESADDLEDELADVLWTLICLANQEGVNLDKGIERAINKLLVRDKNRFKKKHMKFVILHGTDASHESNWFSWLKNELERLGHDVWVPDLPGAKQPNIARYNKFLLGSGYDFTGAVLIGHSSGTSAIYGLLQELPDSVTIKSAILVGTFKGDLGWDSLHGVDVPFDFVKISTKADRFIVIHSDNDPYCSLEGAKGIATELGAEFILLPGQGHFSKRLDERFHKFPEILEIIEQKIL